MKKVSNTIVAVWMIIVFSVVIFFSPILRSECCPSGSVGSPGGVVNNTYAHAWTVGSGASISGSQSIAGFKSSQMTKTPTVPGGIAPKMELKSEIFGASNSFNKSTGNGSGAAFSDIDVKVKNAAKMSPEICDVGKFDMKGNIEGEIKNWSSAGKNQKSAVESVGKAQLTATGFIGNIGGANIVSLKDIKQAMAGIQASGTGKQGGQTKTFVQFNK